MTRKLLPLVLTLSLAAIPTILLAQHINGVGTPTAGTQPTEKTIQLGEPLERRAPKGKNQSPAFPGQTRAPATITQTPIQTTVLAEHLDFPWSLNFLPDGQILITEKPGAMRIISKDGRVGEPIKNVPKVLFNRDAGLMDLTLDPNFQTNRLVYFAYVEQREGDTNGTNIAKARLSDDLASLENLTIILRVLPSVPQTAHYGARLLFDKTGALFITHGERYYDPTRDQAQTLDTLMGKIFRINTDGTPAKGNPFENTPGARPEIWSYGHRNPQGLAFHPVTGELWSSEHGPQGGDEINLILPGKNYGWPVIAYGTNYDGTLINNGLSQKENMEQPLYYWDPAVAPAGCTFYSADLIPEWKNNLFVACLAGQHVARLVIDPQNPHKILAEERLLLDRRERMRDIKQGPDGALYIVTDQSNGHLLRLAPKP